MGRRGPGVTLTLTSGAGVPCPLQLWGTLSRWGPYELLHMGRVKEAQLLLPTGRCRPNVTGRRCDSCAPGFHGYPRCLPCQCHEAGTAPSICDPITGHCHCKVSSHQAPVRRLLAEMLSSATFLGA